MPRIEHIIIGLIVVWAIIAIARHTNRTEADKLRPSWAVRAVNAFGGNVEAKRLLPAASELIGRGAGAVRARWSRGKPARAETREAQRERAAEIAAKAREAAVNRGHALVDAAQRRWGQRVDDRPLIGLQRPEAGTAPSGERAPVGPETPGSDDGDPPIAGQADCPRCGATVKAVIPGTEQETAATCGCGFRITFYRAPNDPPDEAVLGQSTTDRPRFRIVPKEDTGMTATDTRTVTRTPHGPQINYNTNVGGASGPDAATVAQMSPGDWAQVAERVRDFEPGADYELINFMTGEVAGICVYATAYEQLHASCVESIGLDPVAVQGLGEFTEHVMELAKAMGDAHQQFLVHYQEILQAVANGVLLPYNGRWMTGEAAV